MNMGKKAFIGIVTCLAAAVCTTAGAQHKLLKSVNPADPAADLRDHLPPGPLGGGGAGHLAGCETCGSVTITQSPDLVPVAAGGIFCPAGENSYYRGFTLSDFGLTPPFDICSVEFGVQTAIGAVGGMQPIVIRLYDTDCPLDADATPVTGNLIGEATHDLADQSLTVECFPVTGTVTSGGFTVEIFSADEAEIFLIGANTGAPPLLSSVCAPALTGGISYLRAPVCGAVVPTPVGDFAGFEDVNFVMRVFGEVTLEKLCPNDTNCDSVVNVLDLIDVLLCFGLDADPPDCNDADVTQDGVVNVLDLIDVLLDFGTVCPPGQENFLTIQCDQGLVRPNDPLCCDFTWTVTNFGCAPVDTFYLDLEAGPVGVMDCRSIGLPGWVATACYPWDNGGPSTRAVYCFTGGVLQPGESQGGGFLNVEVNPTPGGSNVIINNWIPFFVPEMAIHCHVTSATPEGLGVVCADGDFGPHIDLDDDGAPDQRWSGGNNWICFGKDVCIGAEVITLSNPPIEETVPGVNNTTVGATIDPGAPACPDQSGGALVEILAPGNWYSVIGNGSTLTATTCNVRLQYDSAISVYSGGCGNLTCIGNDGANDDGGIACTLLGSPIPDGSIVTWCSVDGQEYLILIHGKTAADAGAYRLDIISDGIVCSICDPGKDPENEPIENCQDEGEDLFNGGCNNTTNFNTTPITCGQSYCGTYGTFLVTDPDDPKGPPLQFRDLDWYEFNPIVNTTFTWKGTGECDTLIAVVDGTDGCDFLVTLDAIVVAAGGRATIETVCLSPGTYYFIVGPADFTGCECGSAYTVTLTCVEECVQTLDLCDGRVNIFDGLTPFDTTAASTDGPANGVCGQTFLDIWYNYTATCTGLLTVTTCEQLGGSADFDTEIVVYDGCECGGAGLEDPPLGCNDDDPDNPCGEDPIFQSTVVVPVIGGNCYKIRVGSVAAVTDPGTGGIFVSCEPFAECPDLCDPAKTLENEPDCGLPTDIVNGGCNDTDNLVFSPISCGDQVCGTAALDGVTRDTDWWQITLAQDEIITWTVTAQFAVDIVVLEATDCDALNILETATGEQCETVSVTTICLPAGTYVLFVAPNFALNPEFLCAEEREYTGSVTCTPCAFPPNDLCADRVAIFDGNTPYDTTLMNTDGPAHLSCEEVNDLGVTGNDIWFNYTATCTGTLSVNTCEQLGGSATYDTDLVIYDGCECGAVGLEDPPLGCNDDDPVNDCGTGAGGFHSALSVPVTAGQCYKIRVGGFVEGDFGTGIVNLRCTP